MHPSSEPRLKLAQSLLPERLQHPAVLAVLQLSLAEDLDQDASYPNIAAAPAFGDITSRSTIPQGKALHGIVKAKASGVIVGIPVSRAVFHLVEPDIQFKAFVVDGQSVQAGTTLYEVDGSGACLLAAERTALNFLGRMSGIATLTRRFVDSVAGTQAVILDTRKTAPGLRHLDKYAVNLGGAQNHRLGLFDMVMIKDNHIDGAGSIQNAVERVRQQFGDRYPIEVEVKNLEELRIALDLDLYRIMLDNMDLETMRKAVQLTAGRCKLEASGNVSLETVRAIAETGVDYISSGALTHSAPVLDISMRLR